jgi:hypothetical protein
MSELKTIEYDNTDDVQEGVVDFPTDDESRDGDTDDGRENFVDFQNTDENEDADIGEDAEESDSDGAGQNSEKHSREENAAIRAARLRAQRDAEARVQEQVNRDIAESGVINPLTGKPFSSLKELREYGKKLQRTNFEERAKREGRSVDELEEEELNRKFITSMRLKEEARSKPQEQGFIESDVMDFIDKHPEFNTPEKLSALENNKSFREFCGTRFGREPLSDLYESYISLVGRAGDIARAKSESRMSRSTGSGNDGGEMLTPSEKRSLDEWNEKFPEMKMTPKEFKARR